MMMSELPMDLLEEILCRVPAMSLKWLRYTCKRWNRLFHDSRFTRNHLEKAAKQFLLLMLRKEYKICSIIVNLHHEIPSIKVTGLLTMNDSHSNSLEINITRVFHCDGLLLCTLRKDTRILVWNPCTGQTKWIQHINCYKHNQDYTLGYGNNSYKILCYNNSHGDNREFEIYEINSKSNSWRILQVTPYCNLVYITSGVSLKGKTYFLAVEKKQEGVFLVSFDYTIEKFGRMCLPYNCHKKNVALSAVREEKLSVFLQDRLTSKTEIWVTNKIDETKVVSWSKVLTVDYPLSDFWLNFTFLFNEEKKVVVGCESIITDIVNITTKEMVYIVGEDNKATQVNFAASTLGTSTIGSCGPILLNYVPNLVQIEQGGGKRKRDD